MKAGVRVRVPSDTSLSMSAARLTALALLLSCCSPGPAADAPVRAEDPPSAAACRRTGCSGEVCSGEDVVTPCEWKPEYACYRQATCARGADGACGWILDDALRACLERAGKEGGGQRPR